MVSGEWWQLTGALRPLTTHYSPLTPQLGYILPEAVRGNHRRRAGVKANGTALGEQARIVATDATVVVLENTGHWMMEENPQQTMDALTKFL